MPKAVMIQAQKTIRRFFIYKYIRSKYNEKKADDKSAISLSDDISKSYFFTKSIVTSNFPSLRSPAVTVIT